MSSTNKIRIGDEVRFLSTREGADVSEVCGRVVGAFASVHRPACIVRSTLGEFEHVPAHAIVAVRPEMDEAVRLSHENEQERFNQIEPTRKRRRKT